MHPKFRFFRSLAPLVFFFAGALALSAAEVISLGDGLPGEIRGLFAPPTRSDAPWAASAEAAFQWDAEAGTWAERYRPPWTDSEIEGLGGYAKSSKVLYLAHGGGVARTNDGGESWTEAIPAGFGTDRGALVGVVVDPHERKHAVVAYAHRVWETVDYGSSYRPLPLEPATGTVRGVAFLPTEENASPMLVVASAQGLMRFEGGELQPAGHWKAPNEITNFAAHPIEPVLFLGRADGTWNRVRIGGGDRFQTQTLAGPPTRLPVAAVLAGSNSLWSLAGEQLEIFSLSPDRADSNVVTGFSERPGLLVVHPRESSTVYIADPHRVWRVNDAFTGLSAKFVQAAEAGQWQTVAWQYDARSPARPELAGRTTENPMDVAVVLQRLLREEPPVKRIIEAVLVFEQTDPEAFRTWRGRVSRRNWIPELRVEGGVREYTVDQSILNTSVDRYGIENIDDLRLSDRIQNLGWVGFVMKWDLDQAYFDDDVIDVSRERRASFEQRREVVQEVTELYYQRISVLAELEGALGEVSAARQMLLILRFHQLTTLLNGYCGQDLLNMELSGL